MRVSLIIISLFLLLCFACNNKNQVIDYKNYYEKTIALTGIDSNYNQKDTLALLSIKVPERLDTFYQWHRTSCCMSCGWIQYRFGDSHYKKFAESGFFMLSYPDSVYHITIRHKPKRWTPDSINLKPFSSSDTGYSKLPVTEVLCKESEVISIEYAVINGRPFWITQVSNACSLITGKKSIYVAAVTNLTDQWLEVIGECSAKDTAGFRNMIYNSIKSIKITEKQ